MHIPITLVTGFLGAGKTTLINRLLKENHGQQIAVIINEYGEIGVDHKFVLETDEQIFQMNNGCICCTLRADIANLLRVIWDMQQEKTIDVSHIIFETTGLADPAPILQTFLQVPFLKEHFKIDSVLAVVDAGHIATQLQRQAEPKKQIAVSDLVLLSKTSNLSTDELAKVQLQMNQLNSFQKTVLLEDSKINLLSLLSLDAFDVRQDLLDLPLEENNHHHHHAKELSTVHHADVHAFVLQTTTPLELSKINRFFDALIDCYGPDLYRYKGILNLENRPQQVIFQGVHMTFDFTLGKFWPQGERQSVLVLIGKNLPEEEIRNNFHDYFS